jgi:hypothetical protein
VLLVDEICSLGRRPVIVFRSCGVRSVLPTSSVPSLLGWVLPAGFSST